MKKITLNLLVAAVIVLFLFTGCDKYHRDRYTGTWEFTTEMVYFNNLPDPIILKRDTVYYMGEICLENTESGIIIKYTVNDEISAWLDKEGYIYHKDGWTLGKGATGQFESKDKMHLNSFWGGYVPLEGVSKYRTDYIRGTKKGRR